LRNTLLYVLLRIGAPLVARLPARVSYAIASAAASVAFLVARPARAAIEHNLALAFSDLPRSVRSQIALDAFRHDAMNWIDTLRIPALAPETIPDLVDIDGWEIVERAVRAGNGVVFALLHIGNFDLVGQVLAARRIPLTVPVERMQPERLFQFLTRTREAQGIRLVPVDRASRPLLRALRQGAVVGVAADRRLEGRSVVVDFLGRRVEFALGPAELARRTGAALLIGVGIREGVSQFKGLVFAVEMPRTDDPRADEQAATQQVARIAESLIRAYPGQWLAFSPLPQTGDISSEHPATIRRRNEAVR
jgi:KDO2-lipid IV(A) lauroyltransferase